MEKNIILLVVITAVAFFVVGNPITYGIMSKITGLKVKNKKDHMLLVVIHSVVMTALMYAAFEFLIKDKKCPPAPACPPQAPCPVCEEKKQADQPAVDQPPAQPAAQPPAQPPVDQPLVEGYGHDRRCGGGNASGYMDYR